MVTHGKTRAAIYARVSTEGQEREGTSLESQVERCLGYVQEQGWSVEPELVVREQGSGGDIIARPRVMELHKMAKAGRFDVLVVYHIDRLSRDTWDQGWYMHELRLAGVKPAFVTGQQNPVFQAVEGAMAMQQRTQTQEQTTRAKAQTARGGRYLPGPAPFGYTHRRELIDRKEKVMGLDPNPVTAPILRDLFESLARGETATGCAKRFNREGIPPSRGLRWHHSAVCTIVRNPLYKGQLHALRYRAPRDERTRKSVVQHRPVEEWVLLPADIAPALVTPDLWQRANDQIDAGKTGARRRNLTPELWLLRAGFVKCGNCGAPMSAGRIKGKPAYLCKQTTHRGCNRGGSILAATLDQAVWTQVEYVLRDPAWIREQLEQQVKDSPLPERIAEQQRAIGKLRQQEARLAKHLEELDDATPVIQSMNAKAAQREKAESELKDLLFHQRHNEQIAQRLSIFDQRFLDFHEGVDSMSYQEKRAILRQFAVRVTLWPRTHDPRYVIDWAYDLGDDWWQREIADPDFPVIYTLDTQVSNTWGASEPAIADRTSRGSTPESAPTRRSSPPMTSPLSSPP